MQKLSITFRGTIKPNINVIIWPVIMIFIMITLYVLFFNFTYKKIQNQFKEIKEKEKVVNILETKLELLKSLQGGILDFTDRSLLLLPTENPSLFKSARLNSLADEYGIIIVSKNIGSVSTLDEHISKCEINFNFVGSLDSIFEFLRKLKLEAPVVTIPEIGIEVGAQVANASTNLNVYWSPYPEKLEELSAPIQKLSPQEEEMLEGLAIYEDPKNTFGDITPQEPSDRKTPFQL